MNDQPRFDYQMEIDKIRNQFHFDFVSLTFVEHEIDPTVLTWQFASGNLNNRYKRIVLLSGKGVAGIVYKTGKPMFIQNVQAEIPKEDWIKYPIVVAEKLQSLGAVPLWSNNRVLGVLLVGFRQAGGLSEGLFNEFQSSINNGFGPFYAKEMKTN